MNKFKEYRRKKGYTSKFVADILGITETTYLNYEQDYLIADYETLGKLANIYGATVDSLIGHTSIPRPFIGEYKTFVKIGYGDGRHQSFKVTETQADAITFLLFTMQDKPTK